MVYINIHNSIAWAGTVSSNCRHNMTKEGCNGLQICIWRKSSNINSPSMSGCLIIHCLNRHHRKRKSNLSWCHGKHIREHSRNGWAGPRNLAWSSSRTRQQCSRRRCHIKTTDPFTVKKNHR
nr:hypothetical protein Iba_chr11eCG8630 [Ipomoea batatas]